MTGGALQSRRTLPCAPTPPSFYRLDNNVRTEDLPLPEWQKKELDKRLAAYDRGEVKTKDYHEVHEALRTKYK